MTIIVTGGAGFLGHHLVQQLLDEGHQVVVFDSLWTGSMDNVRCYEKNSRFRFIRCDVREPLPAVKNVEQIYHLACPASPDHFEVSPIEIMDTCFQGTKNAFDLALKHNARVLITSTSETYGDPQVSPQSEQYRGNVNSFGPRSCYDEGKRITESLAYAYQSKHDLQVRIARIFNAYGPHMEVKDGRAVPNFIAAALEGRPLIVYGDGSATRCFQFATDCTRGLVSLMNSDHVGPVNIGSDHEMPVGVIAEMISKVVAGKLGQAQPTPVQYLPQRQDDPTQRKPDISLAKAVLGWSPKVPLDQGIDDTVNWFLQKRIKEAQRLELESGRISTPDSAKWLAQNMSQYAIVSS